MKNPFRYFKTSPEIIRLAVMMYVRFPLSLRNVEDLLHERGIEVSHETIRFWWNRFGPIFAAEIRKKRMDRVRASSGWRWHLDEMFVKINGEGHYLWRAVDQEGEVLEAFVSKKRDRSFFRLQPLQPGTTPLLTRQFQAQPRRRRCDFSGSSYFAGFFGVFHNRRRFYYLFFNYLFLTI